jgi:hypothetical protein
LCLSESHHVSLLHATRLHPGWAFDQITGDRPLVPGNGIPAGPGTLPTPAQGYILNLQ